MGTLIVGVVGQETIKAVSPTNLVVIPPNNCEEKAGLPCNEMDSMKGKVTALDPLPTLLAVLRGAMQSEVCDKRPSCKENGKEKEQFDRIVIMAQMSRPEAEALSAQLRVSLKKAKEKEQDIEEKRKKEKKDYEDNDGSIVDVERVPILILSEAQDDYFSPGSTVDYSDGEMIPVLTPRPPYASVGALRDPVSNAEFKFPNKVTPPAQYFAATMTNTATAQKADPGPDRRSLLYLLIKKLNELPLTLTPPASCRDKNVPPISPPFPLSDEIQCKRDLNAQLLGALRRGQGTVVRGDVVLLEQRDIFYGNLPEGYTDYKKENCPYSPTESKYVPGCELRVALDRVMWKGDYAERVMITGSDLVALLTTSQQQSLLESSLTAPDVTGQSLATFGIVQPASPNLASPGSRTQEFPIPQDSACGHATDPVTDPSAYCIDGQTIRSDGAYWAITSDHLANDSAIYKVMAATTKDSYHQTAENKFLIGSKPGIKEFLTGAIAEALLPRVPPPEASAQQRRASDPKPQPEAKIAEWDQQLRGMFHVDIGKLVAGFSARQPNGGNVYAENFQGAADSRASTPSQQELDLEGLSRLSWDVPIRSDPGWLKNDPGRSAKELPAISLGVQLDAEYDRAATGNLTNKPTTVVYALNSFTVTPFVQFRLPHWRGPRGARPSQSGRALPRTLLVLSPGQYQEQLTGNYLVFPFSQTPPATTPPTIAGEYTAQAPKVTSHFEKAGLRREYAGGHWYKLDKGSYIEAGFEFGNENNILKSVAVTSDGVTPPPCTAQSSTTIAACFAGYANTKSATYVKGFQIDSTTTLAAPLTTATLHAAGGYWDLHLQKLLTKAAQGASADTGAKPGAKSGVNFTLDSKADWFSRRGAAESLNTQTRYAIPLAMSLNFPVLRNLSLSPTYSRFWYSSEVTHQSIGINTFSIEAKWYFARDASVPPLRQAYFRGPSSADQTSSAKMK